MLASGNLVSYDKFCILSTLASFDQNMNHVAYGVNDMSSGYFAGGLTICWPREIW